MATIPQQDLAPGFGQRAAEIAARKKLAALLQRQPEFNQVVSGRVVKRSPWALLAQGLAQGYGSYLDADTALEEGRLQDDRTKALVSALAGKTRPSAADLAGAGLSPADIADFAIKNLPNQATPGASAIPPGSKLEKTEAGTYYWKAPDGWSYPDRGALTPNQELLQNPAQVETLADARARASKQYETHTLKDREGRDYVYSNQELFPDVYRPPQARPAKTPTPQVFIDDNTGGGLGRNDAGQFDVGTAMGQIIELEKTGRPEDAAAANMLRQRLAAQPPTPGQQSMPQAAPFVKPPPVGMSLQEKTDIETEALKARKKDAAQVDIDKAREEARQQDLTRIRNTTDSLNIIYSALYPEGKDGRPIISRDRFGDLVPPTEQQIYGGSIADRLGSLKYNFSNDPDPLQQNLDVVKQMGVNLALDALGGKLGAGISTSDREAIERAQISLEKATNLNYVYGAISTIERIIKGIQARNAANPQGQPGKTATQDDLTPEERAELEYLKSLKQGGKP